MAAFFTVPHVAQRINRFLDPASGDTFNIDIATESFIRGGWFGRGPGEGTIKRILPEGHTDFVFAVAAEEFGVVLCLILVALFAFIVIRALVKAMRTDDPFIRFAAAGLGDPVRPAIDHQHGGQSASHAGQGNDVAVHLLRRLVADLARLRHGHAAGADPRAAAREARRRHRARRRVRRDAGAESRRRCWLRPAARAVICFRPRRWRRRWPSAALPVHLATDRRAARYGGAFADETIHVIASATLRARNPIALARDRRHARRSASLQAWALIGRLKPAAVIGFGGYPTIPPVLAAAWRGVPSLIHDANAVIGRANRLLAPRVTAIATTFPDVFGDRRRPWPPRRR